MESKIISNIYDEFKCPVCLDIANDAVESSCCHHIFCTSCSLQLNNSCALCRQRTVYSPSVIAQRIIANLPIKCVHCQKEFTRATIKSHEILCGLIECPAPICTFKESKENFLSHLIEKHKDVVIMNCARLFSSLPDPKGEDRIQTKQNSSGRTARLGSSGKYYCKGSLNQRCTCCNGYCGPTAGCNCVECMKLDVESRRLPRGYLVNNEGSIARLGQGGIFYCGRKVMKTDRLCDGYCGPNNGPNCASCQLLDSFKSTRYASLVN